MAKTRLLKKRKTGGSKPPKKQTNFTTETEDASGNTLAWGGPVERPELDTLDSEASHFEGGLMTGQSENWQ